ncbi:hypothetical protein [Clostridium baratii]|nr:hypothetical protein [Clostridium baratii]MDU1052952.1 hypothetical protein [Clostridium baratii]MDU4912828.1 hypothetical protein [Clostridium baratii]
MEVLDRVIVKKQRKLKKSEYQIFIIIRLDWQGMSISLIDIY